MKQLNQIYLVLLLVTGVTGCTTIGYYSQAAEGHLSLMMAGEPVDQLLARDDLAPALKERLHTAQQARTFARARLHLPVGDAFTDYVELDQPWVVVNLVAVPEFSLEPHQWCYPVLGCQAYRGYFRLADARSEQKRFNNRGYDTLLGGVTAYSTLGWFDDPLHSGFTRLTSDRMVALIFHELAHRVLYLDGDTTFNESFATAVELEGLKLWLARQGNPAAFGQALERFKHRDQTQALVQEATRDLEQLYRQRDTLSARSLRRRKAELLDRLAHAYEKLSENWAQPGPFGRSPISLNNANLALFRQYQRYVPGFRQLLSDYQHDFPAFYEAVKSLASRPETERATLLTELSKRFEEDL